MSTQEKITAEELQEKIEALIKTIPNHHLLDDHVIKFMSTALTDDIYRKINKFVAGQLEHGGDFLKKGLDFNQELRKELVDAFWYNEANIFKS